MISHGRILLGSTRRKCGDEIPQRRSPTTALLQPFARERDFMDPLSFSPLGLLTFIAAPAMLTNASSIMTLGTGNRFARAIDRARTLSTLVQAAGEVDTPQTLMHRRQLSYAERRALILVRALTAFYVSVGSFGAASLISLLGAVFVVVGSDFVHRLCLSIALFSGIMGVGGLVIGSSLLVWETRMALFILTEETEAMCKLRSPSEQT